MDDPKESIFKDANTNFIIDDIRRKLPEFIDEIALEYFKDPDDIIDIVCVIKEELLEALPSI